MQIPPETDWYLYVVTAIFIEKLLPLDYIAPPMKLQMTSAVREPLYSVPGVAAICWLFVSDT
ncbi:MAG: hypothetical protein P8Z30_14600 [Acidobacteriota bacterium]